MKRMTVLILLAALLAGCATTSITTIGRLPETTVDCYGVRHHDWLLATGMIVCAQDNRVQAASGGAAAGALGASSGVAQAAGIAAAGVLIGPAGAAKIKPTSVTVSP